MNAIPKLVPIPQSDIDALADSVAICERIAAEYRAVTSVPEHVLVHRRLMEERAERERARQEGVD